MQQQQNIQKSKKQKNEKQYKTKNYKSKKTNTKNETGELRHTDLMRTYIYMYTLILKRP